jgi:hypothetical protein
MPTRFTPPSYAGDATVTGMVVIGMSRSFRDHAIWGFLSERTPHCGTHLPPRHTPGLHS